MSSATKTEPPGKAKSKPLRTKQSASNNAPKLKVVIRRLPPNLPENIFWQSVAQWVTDESSSWKLYVPGKLRTKLNRENTPSRAYVEFVTPDAVVVFNRDYNGHVFRDKQGNESAAVVEYAPYQKVPHEKRKADAKIGTIETDEDFISFLEALNKPAEPTPDVNELVTQGTTVITEPTSTPLLDALKAAKEANTIKGYHSHYRDQPAQPRHRVQDLEDAETFSRKVPLKNQQDLAQSDTRDVGKSKEKEKEGGKRGKNKQKEKAPGTGPGPKSPKPAAAQSTSTAPSRGESSRARPPAGAGINARVLAALGGGAPPGRKGGKQREPSASGAPASESTPAPASTSASASTPSAAPPTSAASLPAGVIAIPGAIKSPETPKKSRGGRGRGRGGGGTSGKDGGGGGPVPTALSDMPRIDDPGQALPPVASTQRGRGGGGGSGRGRGGRGRGRGRGGGSGSGGGGGGGGGESVPSATQGQ